MNIPGSQTEALRRRCRRLLCDHQTRAKRDGATLDYGLDALRQLIASSPTCRWCQQPVAFDVSLDHVRPTARGGPHALHNLAAVCRACNLAKGQLTGEEYIQLLELLGTFHPVAQQDILRRLRSGGRRYSHYKEH
jgi:5-methylcytosine-specific restriction endonuclease McrA